MILSDTKLAVVPKQGDRIAICDFHESIMTWGFLTNSVIRTNNGTIYLSFPLISFNELGGGGDGG